VTPGWLVELPMETETGTARPRVTPAGTTALICSTPKMPPTIGPAYWTAAAVPPKLDDEVSARALEHPEVKRFQELFPDSHVRTVRNLRDV